MTTPKEYFDALKIDADAASSVGAIYQFDITGENGGTWTVDLTKDGDFISEGGSDASQCTIKMTEGDFIDMVQGRLPATQAFMMGKLKIEGNMGLAMKLSSVIG